MKYAILLLPLFALCSCAPFLERLTSPEVMESAGGVVGNLLSGNTAGAIGQSLDVILILLGLKGIHKGGKMLKAKIVNPKPA